MVNLALGLGKTIVDGGLSWTYSPAYPQKPPPLGGVRQLLKNTQNRFWAVHMGRPPLPDPMQETEYMVHAKLSDAEYDDSLRFVASTFDGASNRIVPGVGNKGPRVIDFAPILTFNDIKLNSLLKKLLAVSEEALGAPVEMEFAVNLGKTYRQTAHFGYLQVRPMAVSDESIEVTDEDLKAPGKLLAAEHVMGNGSRGGIVDVIYVKPESFDAAATRTIAEEVDEMNCRAIAAGLTYLLIGFGRWGSSDPWLGIPVDYSNISGARVIVETTLPKMSPDPSQGSHFFQNLIAFQILYFTMRHDGRHRIDWDWLEAQEIVREGAFVKHVRLSEPLTVRADGRSRRGVIRHDVQ